MNPTVLIISIQKFFDTINDTNRLIVSKACCGADGLMEVEKYQPTIIFLDYEIEEDNTDIYIKTLLIESPETRIILVGNHLSDETVLNSLMDGCFGYIDRQDMDQFFDKSIKFVGMGEAWVSRRLVGLLLEKMRD